MVEEEQVEEVKEQLISQIESSQIENKEQIKEYIRNLDKEQLEEFLEKNKIKTSSGGSDKSKATPQCIFCSIVNNETPSYKVSENKKAIAIFEINPLSKGHILVIPKEHLSIEKLPKSSLGLAQKIAKRLKKKLKPEDIKIETGSLQNHAFINIIPIYKNQKIEKRKANEEELKDLQLLLETKKRKARQSKEKITLDKESIKSLHKISFRIP